MRIFKYYLVTSLFCLTFGVAIGQQPTKNLLYFLDQARQTSPLFKDLINQKKSTRIDSMLIKSVTGPQINGLASGSYAPIIHSFGYDEVITNGHALEGVLQLSYDVLNKKRVNNQLKGLKIQTDSLKYAEKMTLYDLDRSITDQYLIAYASQEQVDFNNEVVSLLEKEEVLLKKLTQNNVYKQSEYLTFLVNLQQQQLATKIVQLQFQNDFATLLYLSGVEENTNTRLIEPKLDSSYLFTNKSFFLQRFEIDSLKNDNLKQTIDLNYKPKLGLYATGGFSSSLIFQPYKNFGTSVGFSFSVPIYDGHQKKMQYDKLTLSANTTSYYKIFFNQQQSQQLKLISQQIKQTNSLFLKINEQIRFAKSLMEVDSKLLHTGDLRITDFIIAINNYMSAQNLFRQTTINRLKLINQYNYWNK